MESDILFGKEPNFVLVSTVFVKSKLYRSYEVNVLKIVLFDHTNRMRVHYFVNVYLSDKSNFSHGQEKFR